MHEEEEQDDHDDQDDQDAEDAEDTEEEDDDSSHATVVADPAETTKPQGRTRSPREARNETNQAKTKAKVDEFWAAGNTYWM